MRYEDYFPNIAQLSTWSSVHGAQYIVENTVRCPSGRQSCNDTPRVLIGLKPNRVGCTLTIQVYNGEVSEWPKEHAWKVCKAQAFEGSNPSLTAIGNAIRILPKKAASYLAAFFVSRIYI